MARPKGTPSTGRTTAKRPRAGALHPVTPPEVANIEDARARAVPIDMQVEILKLNGQGYSYRQIGEMVGRSHTSVGQVIKAALKRYVEPAVNELREASAARITPCLLAAMEIALDADNHTELRLKAMDRINRFEERLAVLYGYNQPIRVSAELTEADRADLELQELINEAKARNAVLEGEIESDQG